MTTTMKHCPGYAAQAPHDLAATTENFHKNAPAKDGLFYQCKSCANAYQADYMARQRAIKKADAMEVGPERDRAIDDAKALPPAPRGAKAAERATSERVAKVYRAEAAAKPQALPDSTAARRRPVVVPKAKPQAEAARTYSATGLAANTPRDQYVQEQGGKPGWAISTVAGQEYPLPTSKEAVSTAEGQEALAAIHTAKKAADAKRKRDERAAAKAKAAAATA